MTDGVVLVIGGTGFIGSHLVERLAASGRRVRVASRRAAWPWGDAPSGMETVALDLSRAGAEDDVDRALEGVSAVVNLAGMLARPGLSRSTYDDLHERGTAMLAGAAARRASSVARAEFAPAAPASSPNVGAAAIPASSPSRATTHSRDATRTIRFVHVSTTGVLGPTGTTPLDEGAPPAPVSLYEKSKLAGERAALAARRGGLEVVVVRPGLVYGPRDVHLAQFYRAIASKTFRTIAGGVALWQPVYVEDVARGLAMAIDAPGCDGETFHVAGGERLTVASFAERIAHELGTSVATWGLPYATAMMAGAVLEAAYRPLRRDPPLSRARVRTLTENRVYAIDRARERLGFVPEVSLDEGIRHTVDWYRRNGYL